ncbi:MAG: hypothetical protein R3F17_14270 [Planctomycetota bacterium]
MGSLHGLLDCFAEQALGPFLGQRFAIGRERFGGERYGDLDRQNVGAEARKDVAHVGEAADAAEGAGGGGEQGGGFAGESGQGATPASGRLAQSMAFLSRG